MKLKISLSLILLLALLVLTGNLKAQDEKPAVSAEELAKKLSNPVAALIQSSQGFSLLAWSLKSDRPGSRLTAIR